MAGKNYDWHNVVDVSPYLMYESTGDSEINSDLNMDNSEVIKHNEADDALSCCSDSYDSVNKYYSDRDKETAQCSKKKFKKKEGYFATCLKKKSKKKEQESECLISPNCRDFNDDGDEDDGAINQVWNSCGKMKYVVSMKNNSKSNEPKEENDKLFWDTCLGS